MPGPKPLPLAERFARHVDLNGPTIRPELGSCRLWTGQKHDDGYGLFMLDASRAGGRKALAHRVAFFIEHGRWPEPGGLHHCDVRHCVNAAHLYEGDDLANARDRDARRRGNRYGKGKLSDEKVLAIRNATGTNQQIADTFGISEPYVSRIRSRQRKAGPASTLPHE